MENDSKRGYTEVEKMILAESEQVLEILMQVTDEKALDYRCARLRDVLNGIQISESIAAAAIVLGDLIRGTCGGAPHNLNRQALLMAAAKIVAIYANRDDSESEPLMVVDREGGSGASN